MKKHGSVALVSMFAMVLLAGSAHAQLFYDPPPPLMGQPSFHLYSVPGVTSLGGLATFFACTNTTGGNIRVGVETFGAVGGGALSDPSASSLDLGPGVTGTFATDGAVWVAGSLLGSVPDVGSARILATKRSGVICSAFLADRGNFPPTSMVKLTVVKKKTQKGD
jgi:hypothetical protein